MKTCTQCHIAKAPREYHKNSRTRDGLTPACAACRNKLHREYVRRPEVAAAKLEYERNYKRTRPEHYRAKRRKMKYGITSEQFDALMLKQRGVCAICFMSPEPGRALDVDHHHGSGIVRGLLCRRCNNGIGLFDENARAMRRAIAYVDSWGNL